MLSFLGGVLGVILGLIFTRGVAYFSQWHFTFSLCHRWQVLPYRLPRASFLVFTRQGEQQNLNLWFLYAANKKNQKDKVSY